MERLEQRVNELERRASRYPMICRPNRNRRAAPPRSMLLAILLLVPAISSALTGAAARVNITPDPATDVPLSGYESRNDKPSIGVHDSLYARILVLDDGSTSVAIVSLDLIGINPGGLHDRLSAAGVDAALLVATHTHAGPRVLDLSAPYVQDRSWWPEAPYVDQLEAQLLAGIREAMSSRQPVRLSVGEGQVDLAFNRRLVRADGSVEMIWGKNRTDRIPYPPVDRAVGVVRVDADSGEPVALLATYACHAVVLGSGNRWISADFPGATADHLEAAFPGVIALFLQGAAGDLDPYVDVQSSFDPVVEQGELLGREVERVALQIADDGLAALEPDPEIRFTRREMSAQRLGTSRQHVETGVDVLQIGRRLAFVGLPGEPFVDLQLSLKERSGVPFTFLLGYTNGYAGYLPTRTASLEGGYGASYGHTLHLVPGTGEAMVDEALVVLGERPTVVTGLRKEGAPAVLELSEAHPNPFNASLSARYLLPIGDRVRLRIFDTRGALVRTLLDGDRPAGSHVVGWDGRDELGRVVATGVYVMRLDTSAGATVRKILLLR